MCVCFLKHFGIVGECAADRNALLHPARKLLRICLCDFGEAGAVEIMSIHEKIESPRKIIELPGRSLRTSMSSKRILAGGAAVAIIWLLTRRDARTHAPRNAGTWCRAYDAAISEPWSQTCSCGHMCA